MNTKHFVVISGIVGGVIGSLLTAMLVPPVTAERDKFGEIECTKLTIVHPDYKQPAVVLDSDRYGGAIKVTDGLGVVRVNISNKAKLPNGIGTTGRVVITDDSLTPLGNETNRVEITSEILAMSNRTSSNGTVQTEREIIIETGYGIPSDTAKSKGVYSYDMTQISPCRMTIRCENVNKLATDGAISLSAYRGGQITGYDADENVTFKLGRD